MIIDGVFSGGGVKGIALVGALDVLEEKGFQFKRTAGTSAGSIIAAFIAAGYKSNEIEAMLVDLNTADLLDKRRTWLPIPLAKWLMLYWKLGLYKGDALEQWLANKLALRGIKTFADLPIQTLRVVVSDITNGRLVVIPDDLPNYGIDPLLFPVARAVRMSCSIPYFFEPVRLKSRKGMDLFVDGGVLSNFPMWLFDSEHVKKTRPVIGLRLIGDNSEWRPRQIDNAVEMFGALFETMKDAHDLRYISRKIEKNIIFIPTKGITATGFIVSDEAKAAFIERGRLHTRQFLKSWSY